MAEVRIAIAGREYIVTCQDGEEPRLRTLGQMVDEIARQAGGATGAMNESRLLLFSALLLADKLHDGTEGSVASSSPKSDPRVDDAALALERLADRLESLALRLEN